MKRTLVHVTVDESLYPNVETLETVAQLFKEAASDEAGSVIVTLNGIDCNVEVTDRQEGEDLILVKVSVSQHPEAVDPDEILRIFRVGRIMGTTLHNHSDDEDTVDVSPEYISKHPLNLTGFYVQFADGREDFLVPGNMLV